MAATDRVFADLISGVTSADPGAGGTTLNGAFLADLPAVADPEFIALTLDPEEEVGAPEIVWVTAHTALATSATILRGQEGTTARAHATGTKVVAGFTATAIAELYSDVADAVAALVNHGSTHGSAGGDPLPTNGVSLTMLAAVVQQALVPAGSILATGRATAPSGFLLCDGTAVSRTTYADLFTAISTAFGAGDGSTTFNLPDLRQRFPLGKAASGTGATLGGTGGAIDHVHTGPSHTHTGPSHTHTGPSHTHDEGTLVTASDGSHTHPAAATSAGSHTHPAASASGGSHNHTFSDSFTTSTVGATEESPGTGATIATAGHSHTGSVSGTTSSDGSHTHLIDTDADGTHTHTIDTDAGLSAHTHAISGSTGSSGTGATGASGTGATGASGTGNTGAANAPFQAVNYIIKT